jgi:putative CocE/NonD family hydrolase
MTQRILLLFSAVAGLLPAQTAAPKPVDRFTKRVEMVAMRDGVRLHTEIYAPKQSGTWPFLLVRTPYGQNHDADGMNRQLAGLANLADDGYIFVFQDIRGKFSSEGEFQMIRPPRARRDDPKAIDESTDTSDTIEWLLQNVKGHNQRVGMMGVSYGGWLTAMAALDPHPALKAVSPMASPDDMFLGDDFHHNGAFRLQYAFEYVGSLESSKDNKPFEFDLFDVYEWYLRLGSLRTVAAKHFGRRYPTWNDFAEHPNFDDFWKRRQLSKYYRSVPVPALHVAGWWDQEDFYGPFQLYWAMEQFDRERKNFLVVGPWNHGGWMRSTGDHLGPIQFGSKTGEYFRTQVLVPWFAYWLKDRGTLDLPEALSFRSGVNEWKRHDRWPPASARERKFYFQANGVLAAESAAEGFDAFRSDPRNPVPYRVRPILPVYGKGSTWGAWLTDDQRLAHQRPDVLSYTTPPLKEPVTLSGRVLAKLFASTSESDADWIVKLIDVFPQDFAYPAEEGKEPARLGGYQLMVANEVFRGRYREGFERPVAMKPGQVYEFAVSLHTQDYQFGAGHQIMVQVQSTWFPLIDRNPQRFVPNIFQAQESDFVPAEHRIHRGGRHASHVVLDLENPR